MLVQSFLIMFVEMLRFLEFVVEALLVMWRLFTVAVAMVNWVFPSRLMFCQGCYHD